MLSFGKLKLACGRWLCVTVVSAMVVPSVSDVALAQAATGQAGSQVCFEVVAARPDVETPVSIMVDKCSGRSWVLTRTGKTYRWILIATEPEKPKIGDRAPIAGVAVTPGTAPQNCFTFNARKFCE